MFTGIFCNFAHYQPRVKYSRTLSYINGEKNVEKGKKQRTN